MGDSLLDPKYLHYFITEMIDYLHRDAAVLGLVEGAGSVAMEGFPGFLVDLGFQCCLQ